MTARLSYRQAAAQGASPVRLVILLYDQAIADLQSAVSALARGDIEGRTRMLHHALAVIGCLQATLNKGQGGRVAENLDRFYLKLRAGLLRAQIRQSEAVIRRQIADLMKVREAWDQVDHTQTVAMRQTARHMENEPDRGQVNGRQTRNEWRA
jgi:flagellar secretion chaperone FliS